MTENSEPTPASASVADEIAKLVALKDAGHLTDEEFQQQKSKLLGKAASPLPPPPQPSFAPTNAPPPSFARTMPDRRKPSATRSALIAIGSIVGTFVLLILYNSCTPEPRSSASLVDTPAWQPPEGYDRAMTDNGVPVGVRWLKPSEYRCSYGDSCFGMEIITAESCPNMLYAQITLLNKADVDIGWTNDTAQAVPANQKVRLIFQTYERGVESARIGRVTCR